MILAGVDLAWQSKSNPSAIAIGSIDNNILNVNMIQLAVYGIDNELQIGANQMLHIQSVR